jgi:hypothetical protein
MIATIVEYSTPCVQCGLYPDEHCGQCGRCLGWHEIDCEHAPDPAL